MARTSPVHYIAPSAVSITPNANGQADDLAVTVVRGAKVKVCYQPIADLGYDNANYKEWTLRGRNRRLADEAPYTIYARLSKTDHADGYIVFAAQVEDAETGEWKDPYILSPNTSDTESIRATGADGERYRWGPISERQASDGRSGYWWVKLGTVSEAVGGERTVDLDTGILGTDQYNMDWYLDPDKMPEKPVRVVYEDRGDWVESPRVTYTGESGSATPDGTLPKLVAESLGWTGTAELSFTRGQEIDEPYHFEHLTRCRWLTQRLSAYNDGLTDQELYEELTTPSRGWEEENWVETSRVWLDGKLWECQTDGTTEKPSEDSDDWRLLVSGGKDAYSVELTKSSDSAVIDPSGNVVGGYRTVSKDKDGREFYTYRFHTSVTVMKGGKYLHLCGAMDDDEELGDGNFTVSAVGSFCTVKMVGTTCYITYIWYCNDGDATTIPYTSYNREPEEYRKMRAMTECAAHITLDIEGRQSVTKDYRLQLVHLPTETVIVDADNDTAAVNWSTKRNLWTNRENIFIPLRASSAGQPVMFQSKNGTTVPDVTLLSWPAWLKTPGFSVDWIARDDDADGSPEYPAEKHMAVGITLNVTDIRRTWKEGGVDKIINNTNVLKFNVVTVVDGVEYENVVPFTLNVTTDKAIYKLVPSTNQVVGTMVGGTWDSQSKTITNSHYTYTAGNLECNNVSCKLMSYGSDDEMTEITSASDIHDDITFFINGVASSLAGFRSGVQNSAVAGTKQTYFDTIDEIVFSIRLDGNDYEMEDVGILRNGAQITVGDDGFWYIGGVSTEVFAKGTQVTDTKMYYTDPMTESTPPAYNPKYPTQEHPDWPDERGLPCTPYLKTSCPASKEGMFIHYVSITKFSDSTETYVYAYGTVGTGNTITVIHDRDYHASASELSQAQLRNLPESAWSESTPDDYSATNKYLYGRDTARYYKNGAQVENITVGDITYPKIVYTLLSYWGQDGSGVEFAYFRADDDSAAKKPTVATLTQNHAGTKGNPVIADWSGSDGGWYDDNPGFTAQGQVMYQSVNKYMGGEWSGWQDPVIIERYAENAVRLDITNEMDGVRTDSTGKVETATTISTKVHLFDGASLKSIGLPTVTVKDATGTTVSLAPAFSPASGNTTERTLTWTFAKGTTVSSRYDITISYQYKNVTYTASFTIVASMGRAVYQLQPSVTELQFRRNNDNSLTAPAAVSLIVTKIDGNGSADLSSFSNTGTIDSGKAYVRYSKSSMPASKTAGDPWTGNVSVTVAEVTRASSPVTNLYIAVFDADGFLHDRETIPVVKDGQHGENAVRLDLDNENDSMLYSSGSSTPVSGNVTSTAYMFDGAADVSAKTTFTISARSGCTAQQATISGHVITVTGINAATATVTVQGVYTDGHGNQHTKTAVLTIKKITDGDKYEIVTSPTAIAYNATKDNPATTTVNIYVYRTYVNSSGSVTRTPAAPPSGYSVYANGAAATATSATGVYTAVTDNSAITELVVKIASSASTTTDIIDLETVPVNKASDGADGESSAIAFASPDKISIPCNSLGMTKAKVEKTVAITIRVGTHAATVTGITPYSVPSGVTATVSGTNVTVSVAKNLSSSDLLAGVVLNVNGTYDGKAYAARCTIALVCGYQGESGGNGHVGRWYYYAGEYSGVKTYRMDQTQAPFVKYNDSFYMLDNGGTEPEGGVLETNVSPGATSNNPWTLMQSTFQYYIAEAYFGDYAHLGSFIINGDWMISQQGGIGPDLTASDAYTMFDPAYPTTSVYTNHRGETTPTFNFVPNFAVDAKTGTTYQRRGFIGGFDIGEKALTNTDYSAGIQIRSAAGYTSRSVQLGANANDPMTNKKAAMTAYANDDNTNDGYNTAIYLEARAGNAYNYAFHGYGNGVLNGYVMGFKVSSFTAGATNYPTLKNGMTHAIVDCSTSNDKYVYLPTLGEVRKALGIVGTDIAAISFCAQMVIINQAYVGSQAYNMDNIYVQGGTHDPKTIITAESVRPRLLRVDQSLTKVDIPRANLGIFFITYIDQRFVANFIKG